MIYGTSGAKMNKEFSGGGQGAGARENKGWDHWKGFERWERKGHVMGVLKGGKQEKEGEITQQCLKCTIEKWLNDGKHKRRKFASTFRNEGCQEKQRRKKLKTNKCTKQKWLVRRRN